jgi:hypothetical protein
MGGQFEHSDPSARLIWMKTAGAAEPTGGAGIYRCSFRHVEIRARYGLLTLICPKSARLAPLSTSSSLTNAGLTEIGVMTSVSSTPLGTVLIILSKRFLHVSMKRSLELAKSFMRAPPSELKMRKSELVVVFDPITSGSTEVFEINVVALTGRD